jgi:hypothetical protein
MSGFKYFRNKQTGKIMRALALPYMGQNSPFEEISEADFRKPAEEAPPKKAPAKKAAKKEAPPETPPVSENDDLTAGLDYGEDSR